MRRENTFKIDYSSFPVKPSFEKVHDFCRSVLGLRKEDVKRLQCHRGGSCAYVKVADLALAQKIVEEHDDKHEVKFENGKKLKLRITMEDGSVEVKVHDLPEDIPKEKVIDFLSAFGEVLSIRELMWGENYDYGGVPLGIWSVRMLVKKNIDSWVTIDGEQALVVYKGQLQSCRHCHEQAHTGISCVQNKKLLVQKSYANVTKQNGPRPQPKPPGPRPVNPRTFGPKPVNPRPIVPEPIATPVITSGEFPELPVQSDTTAQSDSQVTLPLQTQQTQNSSPSQQAPPNTANPSAVSTNTSTGTLELFKKPPHALRSQSKNGNGNETDESSTSTSSRRSRADRRAKKPRRASEDEEQVVEIRS